MNNMYAMSEGTELAAFRYVLTMREMRAVSAVSRGETPEDLEAVFGAIRQHPAAALASAVDDAWLAALDAQKEEGR